MTREIKFRAWDKDKKRMREVTEINWYDEYMLVDETPMSGDRLPIEGIPLMQYTGLKDKNGKEIYEGDIVQLSINEKKPHHLGKVEYLPPKFFVIDGEKSGLILTDRYEVIGNIYENPELLNKQPATQLYKKSPGATVDVHSRGPRLQTMILCTLLKKKIRSRS